MLTVWMLIEPCFPLKLYTFHWMLTHFLFLQTRRTSWHTSNTWYLFICFVCRHFIALVHHHGIFYGLTVCKYSKYVIFNMQVYTDFLLKPISPLKVQLMEEGVLKNYSTICTGLDITCFRTDFFSTWFQESSASPFPLLLFFMPSTADIAGRNTANEASLPHYITTAKKAAAAAVAANPANGKGNKNQQLGHC